MNTKFEQQKFKQGYSTVIGCDEVGRGCLAGPVVAGVVLVTSDNLKVCDIIKSQVKDSKQLSPKKREELASFIKQNFQWGIGEVSSGEIDKINIHQATLLAMRKAVQGLLRGVILSPKGEESKTLSKGSLAGCHKGLYDTPQDGAFVVIDGKFIIPKFNMEQEAIIDGDNKIFSIAAASIVAKVYRDELMRKMHTKYPQYAFAQHKGYGTLHHRNMITKHGLCLIHRRGFCKKLIV